MIKIIKNPKGWYQHIGFMRNLIITESYLSIIALLVIDFIMGTT